MYSGELVVTANEEPQVGYLMREMCTSLSFSDKVWADCAVAIQVLYMHLSPICACSSALGESRRHCFEGTPLAVSMAGCAARSAEGLGGY